MKITHKPVEKTIALPMEEFLNIESETTITTRMERETELAKAPEYDEKDNEIETGYQEIADKAINAFEALADEAEAVEGKYKARIGEVQNSFLGTALEAIKAKAKVKEHKDKMVKKTPGGAKTINNTVFINREDLLKTLQSEPAEVITVEHTEIKGE